MSADNQALRLAIDRAVAEEIARRRDATEALIAEAVAATQYEHWGGLHLVEYPDGTTAVATWAPRPRTGTGGRLTGAGETEKEHPMIETCRSCRYWDMGQCRRHAPISAGVTPDYPTERPTLLGYWPSSSANDWCGEYENRGVPVSDEDLEGEQLGRATTRALLEELVVRGALSDIGNFPQHANRMAGVASNLLDNLPSSLLDYRPVVVGTNWHETMTPDANVVDNEEDTMPTGPSSEQEAVGAAKLLHDGNARVATAWGLPLRTPAPNPAYERPLDTALVVEDCGPGWRMSCGCWRSGGHGNLGGHCPLHGPQIGVQSGVPEPAGRKIGSSGAIWVSPDDGERRSVGTRAEQQALVFGLAVIVAEPVEGQPGVIRPRLLDTTKVFIETDDNDGEHSVLRPKRTIEDIVGDMTEHSIENPTHGIDCSCKDALIREARRIVNEGGRAQGRHNSWRPNFTFLTDRLNRDRAS